MLRAIPEWLDNAKMQDEGGKVLNSMKGFGYNDQEIAQMLDHRMMVMARKAFLYDQISSQKPGDKQVKTPPKVAKPGAAVDTPSSKKVNDAKARLQQTGSRQDAAALFKTMFKFK